MRISAVDALSALLLAAQLTCCRGSLSSISVELPDGAPGVGFDDLRYSSSLHRVLVPAGRSGRLNLIDPETLSVRTIGGFSSSGSYSGGHDEGPTSVEEARGKLYVTDRTNRTLVVADPESATIVSRTTLGAEPDYVRFVEATNELWVTEPAADRLEMFELGRDGTPTSRGTISVPNGPESLVIDGPRARAYTHRWQHSTVAIDVASRSIVAEWPNGCAASRGIALDRDRGWLFVACNDGTVTVLDVKENGKTLSSIKQGSGFDVIGYNPKLAHLYLAGSTCRCLVVLGITRSGGLTFLERHGAPANTHCATADDIGHAWLCDPDGGKIWRIDDRQPRTF